MRIISGSARGTKLFTLEGENTRPTLDRVKEALFSKINEELKDKIILDLFSGSGALAIESLSRGAKKAYLCDNSFKAIKIIKQNVLKTKMEEKCIISLNDYQKNLEKFKNENLKFDIVFLDPPYKTNFAVESLKFLINNDMLYEDGFVVLETDLEKDTLNNLQEIDCEVYDVKKYGRVSLIFIRRKG